MCDTETGPLYNVPLIDTLPIGSDPNGMLQQLPSRSDLIRVAKISQRTVAGYEVLLAHYRRLQEVVAMHLHKRMCHECESVAYHKDNAGEWVRCANCGSMDTRRITDAQ